MQSQTTSRFWKSFNALPPTIQEKARKAFELWSKNSNHPSLHFKKIHSVDPIYSVRIDLQYRALGIKDEHVLVWFWIGTHEEYNNLISEI
jgi:hypothetical protein